MTHPIVHCGLSLFLLCVAVLMAGLSVYIKIEIHKELQNVFNVMESFKSGALGPISPDGLRDGLDLDDLARKIDTMFWFFSVAAIVMISRAVIFAMCASKSESQCLRGIRMEVITCLTEKSETKDLELSKKNVIER